MERRRHAAPNVDRATSDGVNRARALRQYVNSIFGFGGTDGREHYLGETYSGEWADASTFELVAIDTAIPRPEVGTTVVRSSSVLRNVAGTAYGASRKQTITGSFGRDGPPVLVAFEAADPMQTRPGPSPYDTLTLRFDRATDVGKSEIRSMREGVPYWRT